MATIKQGNPKAFDALNARIKELADKQGKVGWFETAKYQDGKPVAYVASIQEFGSPEQNIPPRSFMRSTAIEEQTKWAETAASGAKQILAGKENSETAMQKIVLQAQGDVSKKIASIQDPPLSPITLGARKYRAEGIRVTGKTIGEIAARLKAGTLDISGVSTKPLEDTGFMSATLTSIVENNSGASS